MDDMDRDDCMHMLPRHHQMMSWSDTNGITGDDARTALSVIPADMDGFADAAPSDADHPCDRMVVAKLPDGRRVESSVTWTSDGGAGLFDAPLVGIQWVADVVLSWDVVPECSRDDGVRSRRLAEAVLDVPAEFDDDDACRGAVWGFLVRSLGDMVG